MSEAVFSEILAPAEPDDLDAAYAEIRREPYTFTWAGQSWTLPHLGALDYRLQGQIEQYDSMGVKELEDLFLRLFGVEQAERWQQVEVPTPVLFMLFDRWLKYSGAQLGEDPPSTSSSEHTGEPSRATSAASTTSDSRKRSTAKKATPAKRSPRGKSST